MRNPRTITLASALAALALATPSAAGAQGPSSNASCNGALSSLVAHEQRRDDVSYFVKLGADMGVRENSGAFFGFYAHQHAGSVDDCLAIPEP